MTRDMDDTIYRITVEDIYQIAEVGEQELTDKIVERVIHKIEAMDFSDMADTISVMIDLAIEEGL